jgi:hypothetical protein
MHQLMSLLCNSSSYTAICMADTDNRYAGKEIDVATAVGIVEILALSPLEVYRGASVRIHQGLGIHQNLLHALGKRCIRRVRHYTQV